MRPQIDRGQETLVTAPADGIYEALGLGFAHQVGDRPRGPASAPYHRLAGQRDQFQARDGAEFGWRARPRPIVQSWQPVALEANPPTLYGSRMDTHSLGDRRRTPALLTGQDDPRPHRVALETGPRANSPLEFAALFHIQRHPAARPSATGHGPTASWRVSENQTFSTTNDRSAESDFSGGISGSHH